MSQSSTARARALPRKTPAGSSPSVATDARVPGRAFDHLAAVDHEQGHEQHHEVEQPGRGGRVPGVVRSEGETAEQQRHHAEGQHLPEQHAAAPLDAQVLARDEQRGADHASSPTTSPPARVIVRGARAGAERVVRAHDDRGAARDDVTDELRRRRCAPRRRARRRARRAATARVGAAAARPGRVDGAGRRSTAWRGWWLDVESPTRSSTAVDLFDRSPERLRGEGEVLRAR